MNKPSLSNNFKTNAMYCILPSVMPAKVQISCTSHYRCLSMECFIDEEVHSSCENDAHYFPDIFIRKSRLCYFIALDSRYIM